MLSKILRTSDDKLLTLLRVALGVVLFPHGAQKVLGWWGGFGFSGTMGFFTQQMHIPAPLVLLVFAAEFLGALGLIFGFLGRIAAFGIAVEFIVAVFMIHIHNGFFMNWTGQQKGEGVEYFILLLAIAIAIIIRGSGAWSIDRLLARGAAPGGQGAP
jgi:putative oxidoreductase